MTTPTGAAASAALERGQVWKVPLLLPDRAPGQVGYVTREKYVIVLQDETTYPRHDDVVVVVASTLRPPTRPTLAYEVLVGTSHGFQRATVIDCRWPFTQKKQVIKSGRFYFPLPPALMDDIDAALIVGLRMGI